MSLDLNQPMELALHEEVEKGLWLGVIDMNVMGYFEAFTDADEA
jgi:hypothetical protein